MKLPEIPSNESERLESLKQYSIIDSLPEQDYDDLAKLASEICQTPVALITLIDAQRQWFKAAIGADITETPREISFCAHAINHPNELMVIPDLRNDDRFSDNPLVTGDTKVAFYAGVPLVNTDGFALGTLCTLDNRPRELNQVQLDSLKALANQVVRLFELRRKNMDLEKSQKEISEANNELLAANKGLIEKNIYFNQASEMICTLNSEGLLTDINIAFERELGFFNDELKENKIFDLIHPDDLNESLNVFNKVKSGKSAHNFENRLLSKSGKFIWFQWNAVLYDGLIYATGRNISLQKKQEESIKQFYVRLEQKVEERTNELSNSQQQLLQSNYFLKKAQEISNIGHWVCDLENNATVTCSEETHRIFGKDQQSFHGTADEYFNSVHPDDIHSINSSIVKAIAGRKDYQVEHRVIRSDNSCRWVHASADFIRDEKGNPLKMVGLIRDITEQKNAEQERTHIIEDLLARNKDLQQFAYIVSHNLRAPLANIKGIAEAVNENDIESDDKEELLKDLTVSVNKMDNVIRDLNSILQVRRTINEQKEIVNIPALIDDLKLLLKTEITGENILITTDLRCGEIMTIKSYLHSILYNLLSNSIKYRRKDIQPEINITSERKDNCIIIKFKDNGTGIDMKRWGEHVFGLYKRFHKNIEGRGLGLYMVKTQVESLGGKINMQSEINNGTTFILNLNV